MAGIYIHIPFCRKACHYCNFHFSTSTRHIDDFFTALLQEVTLRRDYLGEQAVNTIYFGGGTPSLAATGQLQQVINRLKELFTVAADAEYTLEANPDDINPAKLESWKEAGINRLSIGVQSFFEEHLHWMNRAHHAGQARQCIEDALAAGFSNLTIDLIYGTPGLTDEQWRANIATAAGYGIPHLSCYALTVEPGTALDKMITLHKKEAVDPEAAARHFEILMEEAAARGFEHYEVSNFAKPGYRSRHNTAYWQGTHYLGLGPSAHSFNGISRQWNISNNALYIQSLRNGELPFEAEVLTPVQQLNEYIMTALRTSEGIHLDRIAKTYGEPAAERIRQQAARYIAAGTMLATGQQLILTHAGKLFADGIAADLFA